jgi:signal transduction histidine kinase
MEHQSAFIVEDDATLAAFIANQLRKLGYKIIDFAVDSEEALSFIETNKPPDLIFMDIFLRGKKNGIDTAREIYKRAKVPIIFSSAPENFYLLDNTKFIKNPEFLSKPFDMEEIKRSIANLAKEELNQTPEYVEAERLRTLNTYEILDTPREGNFDRITKLAAMLLRVPIALVSVVDRDRIWFKSRYGFPEKEIPKSSDLFASSFLSREFDYISAKSDQRALANPILAYDSGFEFYASAPLITSDGHHLGILCVLDKKPRRITEEEKKILSDLAAVIMDEMEMRLAARQAYRLQREFLNMAVHDLKNPLSSVLGFSSLLQKENDMKLITEYNDYIGQSANKMLEIVEALLKNSLMELDQVHLHRIPLHLSEVVESVIAGNKVQAQKKRQKLRVSIKNDPIITADPVRLGEALDNLLSNAIKYSPPEEDIDISVNEASGMAHFEVKDRGPGLTPDERERVFEKFANLSARPTGGETSTGLGLSISKKLIELHGGTIHAESAGKQKGSTFSVDIPVASAKEKEELMNFAEKAQPSG